MPTKRVSSAHLSPYRSLGEWNNFFSLLVAVLLGLYHSFRDFRLYWKDIDA
jgi:hypothetical protein